MTEPLTPRTIANSAGSRATFRRQKRREISLIPTLGLDSSLQKENTSSSSSPQSSRPPLVRSLSDLFKAPSQQSRNQTISTSSSNDNEKTKETIENFQELLFACASDSVKSYASPEVQASYQLPETSNAEILCKNLFPFRNKPVQASSKNVSVAFSNLISTKLRIQGKPETDFEVRGDLCFKKSF